MALKGWLKRLEQAARGDLANFMLEDGSRHYFDPKSGELFLHGCACLRAQHDGEPFPEPPETIKALRRARDRGAALELVTGGTLGIFPYDPEALVERGVLVPRSLVAGRELGAPVEDLSE
jgi:hypothetical protein